MAGAKLGLNVDHIATVRQARGGHDPDPAAAAAIGELAGAHGIVVHLRGDRRHIQDRDIEILRRTVKGGLNIEMAATEEMLSIAERIKPDQVTLVPERPGEVTTEGGLDAVTHRALLSETSCRLKEAGIIVSLFIDPDPKQVEASQEIGAEVIEINTDAYSKAANVPAQDECFSVISNVAGRAANGGLIVAAGHGLDYLNARRIAYLPEVEELNIGHNIIARATLVGLDRAVRDMLALIL